jgi:hypothetical protein
MAGVCIQGGRGRTGAQTCAPEQSLRPTFCADILVRYTQATTHHTTYTLSDMEYAPTFWLRPPPPPGAQLFCTPRPCAPAHPVYISATGPELDRDKLPGRVTRLRPRGP